MSHANFTPNERSRIEAGIRDKYVKVAHSPEGLFKFPTGRNGLDALGYDPELLESLPPEVQNCYCGVGNPLGLAPVEKGITILDLGCGAGVDTLVAGLMTGPDGKAVGMDLTPEMATRAEHNRKLCGLDNVEFRTGSVEELPFEDASFDMVISNAALNLVPGKKSALTEAFRVLKPGGELRIADQVLDSELAMDRESMISCWFR